MSRNLSTRNISSKSMHAFLSNLANRQMDRQTDKRTRANAFTSSFVGGNKHTVTEIWTFSRVISCRDVLSQKMSDSGLKCASRTRTQALRRRRVSRSRKATVSRARCARAPSCWNTKTRHETTGAWLAVASGQEGRRDNMPHSFWHQIWAIWLC